MWLAGVSVILLLAGPPRSLKAAMQKEKKSHGRKRRTAEGRGSSGLWTWPARGARQGYTPHHFHPPAATLSKCASFQNFNNCTTSNKFRQILNYNFWSSSSPRCCRQNRRSEGGDGAGGGGRVGGCSLGAEGERQLIDFHFSFDRSLSRASHKKLAVMTGLLPSAASPLQTHLLNYISRQYVIKCTRYRQCGEEETKVEETTGRSLRVEEGCSELLGLCAAEHHCVGKLMKLTNAVGLNKKNDCSFTQV